MQIPVGNWGGVDLVVDQSIGERDSSLGSLVRKKRQEAIPWCPPRGVSRSVLYSKRLYPIPPRTTLSFRRQFRTSLVLPLEIIFNSTPKSSTQRTKTNQNACLKKKKIRARSKKMLKTMIHTDSI